MGQDQERKALQGHGAFKHWVFNGAWGFLEKKRTHCRGGTPPVAKHQIARTVYPCMPSTLLPEPRRCPWWVLGLAAQPCCGFVPVELRGCRHLLVEERRALARHLRPSSRGEVSPSGWAGGRSLQVVGSDLDRSSCLRLGSSFKATSPSLPPCSCSLFIPFLLEGLAQTPPKARSA